MRLLHTMLAEVESSRTHFEVLGLGLKASSPRKLACPQLADSSIFWIVEIWWSAWKVIWKTFFSGNCLKDVFKDLFSFWDCLKNFFEDFFFLLESTCACVLGPWPRAFLSLASRGSVLRRAVFGLGFFLCPWPRTLCPRLHLCTLVNKYLKEYNKTQNVRQLLYFAIHL